MPTTVSTYNSRAFGKVTRTICFGSPVKVLHWNIAGFFERLLLELGETWIS